MKEGFTTIDDVLREFVNWLEKKGYLKSEYATQNVIYQFLKDMGVRL